LLLSRSRKTSRKKSSSTFISRRAISSSFMTSNVSSTSRSFFSNSSSSSIFSFVFAASKLSTTLKTSFASSSFRFYFFVTTKNARVARLTRKLSLMCRRFVNVFDDIDDIFVFSFSDSKSLFFFIQIHFIWIRLYVDLQSVNFAKHLRSTRDSFVAQNNSLCESSA
jgi:hypothetical protein